MDSGSQNPLHGSFHIIFSTPVEKREKQKKLWHSTSVLLQNLHYLPTLLTSSFLFHSFTFRLSPHIPFFQRQWPTSRPRRVTWAGSARCRRSGRPFWKPSWFAPCQSSTLSSTWCTTSSSWRVQIGGTQSSTEFLPLSGLCCFSFFFLISVTHQITRQVENQICLPVDCDSAGATWACRQYVPTT